MKFVSVKEAIKNLPAKTNVFVYNGTPDHVVKDLKEGGLNPICTSEELCQIGVMEVDYKASFAL